jgi:hypothetical protein
VPSRPILAQFLEQQLPNASSPATVGNLVAWIWSASTAWSGDGGPVSPHGFRQRRQRPQSPCPTLWAGLPPTRPCVLESPHAGYRVYPIGRGAASETARSWGGRQGSCWDGAGKWPMRQHAKRLELRLREAGSRRVTEFTTPPEWAARRKHKSASPPPAAADGPNAKAARRAYKKWSLE